MILPGALCGQVADRFGRRDTILTVCMASSVAALLLLGLRRAGLGVSLLFGLVGMAPAGVIMALAGEALRAGQRAFGMGVFFTVYYAIMITSPSNWRGNFRCNGRFDRTHSLRYDPFRSRRACRARLS
ncbi:hypothetical protein SAMN05444004_12230 [Jannaschia faecimaris]|uniref:Major Facilitator Superfamily protein n=2 Tax=Jannaschia faecimaris TaxID=1244108 RepID=A0A1H3U2P4_9RHOB|nr:hypothetical protein SAMN05444004_12230 [Jannaschia faecimaris]